MVEKKQRKKSSKLTLKSSRLQQLDKKLELHYHVGELAILLEKVGNKMQSHIVTIDKNCYGVEKFYDECGNVRSTIKIFIDPRKLVIEEQQIVYLNVV